jgi:large subunit ribosomal protein L4
MKAAALRGALSDRARNGNLHIVSSFVEGIAPSTKTALSVIANIATGKNILAVVNRGDDVSALSLRNAANIHVLFVDQLNTYDVLLSDDVVFTKAAIEQFLAGPIQGKSVKAVASESEIA